MCRLFGLSSAPHRTKAMFGLLDAPDSLRAQSHRDPDGTGLGYFEADGTPRVHKAPLAAFKDTDFATEAKEVCSSTFLAHIRYASTGGLQARNTHPFEQHGRLFAHNGVIQGLDALDERLGADRALVAGETDSERFFALITKEIDAHDGDVATGIESAARWIAQNLPVFALNIVLTTPDELWALRYPETHELYVLQRPAGGHHGDRHLEHSGSAGRMRVRSRDLALTPAVVIASERMDEHPGWRLMTSGELLHVGPDLSVSSRRILPDPPVHQLTLDDLGTVAAASQKTA